MKNAFRIGFLVVIAIVLAFSALAQPISSVKADCPSTCQTPAPVMVSDDSGCSFDWTTNRGEAPLSVTFSNTGEKGNTVIWYFADGATTSGEMTNHTFTAVGEYQVRYVVLDVNGNWKCSRSTVVTVVAPENVPGSAPVSSSTQVVPQISTSNSADSASTTGDNSPIIVGNNNNVNVNVYPVVVVPCDTAETKTGFLSAVAESWKTFFQTLFSGKK